MKLKQLSVLCSRASETISASLVPLRVLPQKSRLTLSAVAQKGAREGLGTDSPVQTRHSGALVDVLFARAAREPQRACAGKGAWRSLRARASVPTGVDLTLVNVLIT